MHYNESSTHYLIKIQPADKLFQQKLGIVKSLPGREWNERDKIWQIPKTSFGSLNALLNVINNKLKSPAVIQPTLEEQISPLPELIIDIKLKKQLHAFQGKGVAYNLLHGNTLNGDQQGLGKTIETIATVVAGDLFPCLVIAKKSLIGNWINEWKDWTDKEILQLTPSIKQSWPYFFQTNMAEVGIINYDMLESFFVHKIQRRPKKDGQGFEPLMVRDIIFREDVKMWKSIIVDESHKVKDGSTKTSKICMGITKTDNLRHRGVYLLSGTPILNDAKELYPQLTILNRQHLFGTLSEFTRIYSGKKNKGNLRHLNILMHKHCYFRRLKAEVKSDLPPKTRSVVLCDINNRDEYNLAEQNFKKYLQDRLKLSQGQIDKKLRGEVMVQMGILKKIAAKGKLDAVREWMEDIVEQKEKMVLFGFHKEITEQLANFFPGKSVRLCATSKTPDDLNEKKRRFQQDEDCIICVCSLSADAEGHTLNAASNLGMVELPWHFGKAEQAEDRIHRINNWMAANIYYFLADNTIDRKIYQVIMDKKDLHEKVTGTEEEIEEQVIDKLINLFNN